VLVIGFNCFMPPIGCKPAFSPSGGRVRTVFCFSSIRETTSFGALFTGGCGGGVAAAGGAAAAAPVAGFLPVAPALPAADAPAPLEAPLFGLGVALVVAIERF